MKKAKALQPTVAVSLLILSASLAIAQQSVGNSGMLKGRTYINSALGLSITPAPTLTISENMKVGDDKNTIVLLQALGDVHIGQSRNVMAVYADRLSYYPEGRRSAADYVKRIVRSQDYQGYSVLHENPADHLGKADFLRADFVRPPVRMTILVTTSRGYALVLIFSGGNEEDVNSLIRSTSLDLADHQRQ